ncbi:hypothetical protein AgCh_012204 [Apium graveolens]
MCEGTEKVRSNQRRIMISQYECFMAKHKEGITEVFERFNKLINDLQVHDKFYEAEEVNLKSLLTLPGHLEQKISAIREERDQGEITLEQKKVKKDKAYLELEAKYKALLKKQQGKVYIVEGKNWDDTNDEDDNEEYRNYTLMVLEEGESSTSKSGVPILTTIDLNALQYKEIVEKMSMKRFYIHTSMVMTAATEKMNRLSKVLAMGQALGCVQVGQSTVAVKERFGKFEDVLDPGCHCLPWCLGYQVAGELSLRVQQLNVRCETKTKDNVFVTVVASIQYRALAEKASDAYYKLSNTTSQIQAYVFDVIRSSVPKLLLDSAFEQKNDIAKAVEEELEKAMSGYGFEIVQTLIVDIEPDAQVKRAMNEINAASRMRLAASEKAEADKILQIKRAEGEAESKYLSGLGIARQRQAIVDGLRDSVLAFSENVPGTSAKDVMDMVLVTQYFDTMKEIGASSKSSAVFVPHGPGAVKDIASQIREGLLQGNAAQ